MFNPVLSIQKSKATTSIFLLALPVTIIYYIEEGEEANGSWKTDIFHEKYGFSSDYFTYRYRCSLLFGRNWLMNHLAPWSEYYVERLLMKYPYERERLSCSPLGCQTQNAPTTKVLMFIVEGGSCQRTNFVEILVILVRNHSPLFSALQGHPSTTAHDGVRTNDVAEWQVRLPSRPLEAVLLLFDHGSKESSLEMQYSLRMVFVCKGKRHAILLIWRSFATVVPLSVNKYCL